jgi:hypothetical protein
MVDPVCIDPQAVYDDGAITLALGIPSATLVHARKAGRLRYTRKGRRVLYLGQWIIDWLKADGSQETSRAK